MVEIGTQAYFGLRLLKEGLGCDESLFMQGILLPDLSTHKSAVHCHAEATSNDSWFAENHATTLFKTPNMDYAMGYFRINNPSAKLGFLAHLFLDKWFTLNLIAKYFSYDPTAKQVTCIRRNEVMTESEFFSPNGRLSSICRALCPQPTEQDVTWMMSNIPREIPAIGIPTLDHRNGVSWTDLLGINYDDIALDMDYITAEEILGQVQLGQETFLDKIVEKSLI